MMRLIDADRINFYKATVARGMHSFENVEIVEKFQIDRMPTIDPETIPIVRQLREELALITHQRDVYKSVFERITAHGDCNDCGKVKECQFAPKCGEDTRYNCPLWSGSQKEG